MCAVVAEKVYTGYVTVFFNTKVIITVSVFRLLSLDVLIYFSVCSLCFHIYKLCYKYYLGLLRVKIICVIFPHILHIECGG